MSVEVTKLPSGLTVVTDAMPHLETAALGVWAGVGGLSRLAKHGGHRARPRALRLGRSHCGIDGGHGWQSSRGGCSTKGVDWGWGLTGDYWFIYSWPGGAAVPQGRIGAGG